MREGIKKVMYMLEDEIDRMSDKNDITPNDLVILKDASKSLYYLTTVCAMKGEFDNGYGRMPYNYGDNYGDNYGARNRDLRGRYMGDGRTTYGHMDRSEEKMYLEKMLNEARSEAEREVFRRKLDELNRQM